MLRRLSLPLLAAALVVAGYAAGYFSRRPEPPPPPPPPRDRTAIINDFHRLFYDAKVCTWSNTRWLGIPVLKNPLDLWVLQEIVYETRPDVVIEAGTYLGGAAAYFANLFDLLGHGRVVTIDIKDYDGRARHPRVRFLLGSSTAPEIVEQVKRLTSPKDKVMVLLDSDHRKEHVLEELRIYSKLVTKDQYLVVEDTNINGHPVEERFGPGPMEAVAEFRRENADFADDHMREKYMITNNPKGYLRRIR